jgi:DNA-binding GntR family transcriptional regulator
MKELVRPPTLTTAVVDAIKESILRGDLRPGEPLREVELGKSLQTSRGTVREALRQLQNQGLVELIPYRGAFVTQLTPKKAHEIYTVRALLEPYAVRLGMEGKFYTDEVCQELEDLIAYLSQVDAAERYSEVVSTDIAFHRALTSACEHDLLTTILEELRPLTYLFIFTTELLRSDVNPTAASHAVILDSVRSGDAAAAEGAVRDHILESGELLLRRLDDEDKGTL